SVGNYLGGKLADFIRVERHASWLFLAASILTAFVLMTESPPGWLIRNPVEHWVHGKTALTLAGGDEIGDGRKPPAFLSEALWMPGWEWWPRVLFWTAVVFFVPSVSMGTISPVLAKLAVERLRQSKRTGTAIGQVYAWGMVGSILGTFLTG